MVLLLALATCGYRVAFSPSASTGPGKDRPSANATADVLAPQAPRTPAPSTSPGTATGNGATGTTGTSVVLAPAASNGNGGGTVNCVDPSSGAGNCDHRFGVTVGQAPTLYPGLTRMLPVAFANPNQFDILVTTYRVAVSVPPSQATTCPAANLEVPTGTVTLAPRLTVVGKGSVATTIPIRLVASAPEGCEQASFTVTVNASAVKR